MEKVPPPCHSLIRWPVSVLYELFTILFSCPKLDEATFNEHRHSRAPSRLSIQSPCSAASSLATVTSFLGKAQCMYLQPRPQRLRRIAFPPISVQNIYSVSTFRKLGEGNEATWMLRFNRLSRLEVAVGMLRYNNIYAK